MIDSPRLEELRRQYATAQTERERAELESSVLREIRRLTPGPLTGSHRAVVAEQIGSSLYTIGQRAFLLLAGDLADPLWKLVDEGDLALGTAADLLRRGKHIRVSPETSMSAMLRAIAEYYALPGKKALSNGKFSRHAKFGRPRAVPKPPEAATKEAPTPVPPQASAPDGEFWRRLHEMCLEFAKSRLPDYNDEQIEPTLRTLETDLKVVFTQFAEALRRRRRETPLTAAVARRQLTDACRTLLLDPPTRIEKINRAFFDAAKKRFKALAREYHPDTSAGGEATRQKFESVMQAWDVLQQFQKQSQSTTA